MTGRSKKLTAALKVAVVDCLACGESPSAIVEMLKRDHGIEISRQAVEYYDPTRPNGRNLSPALKELFNARRAAFLAGDAEMSAEDRARRTAALGRIARSEMRAGNTP